LEHFRPASLPRAPSSARATRCAASILPLVICLLSVRPALAQTPVASPGADAAQPALPAAQNQSPPGAGAGEQPAAAPTGFWERSNLLGDIGGLRTFLDGYGISLGLTETSEVLGNPTGGRAQGVVYEGLTQATLSIDLDRAIGLPGGTFYVSGLQIHGRGLSTNDIDNVNTVSSIEADRGTRLFELWYQQAFFDGKVSVKVGQISADQEFMVTQYGGLFVNAMFGWAPLPSADLPSGGSAYPLATPGVRFRVQPTTALTGLLGVFSGNPAGPGTGDPQLRDPSGTNFNVNSGVFVIGEVQYAINQDDGATGLPGTYKLGAWYNSNTSQGAFSAVSPATATGPSANNSSPRKNNWSIYAVMDQLVFRPAGSKDGGAGVFVRAMSAPSDRNEVDLFVEGGITYKGAFGRDNDTMGLGVGWTRFSNIASTDSLSPARTSEVVLEATYQVQLTPWWTVQPDFQYVFNPGGGILNPNQPTKRVGDAAVLGLRTSITF
jgi:porin